ncbi:hypothetical protein A2U01_0069384, partial [Trifolium medium]|nr:hypothetical protein [Trifolium medium]
MGESHLCPLKSQLRSSNMKLGSTRFVTNVRCSSLNHLLITRSIPKL